MHVRRRQIRARTRSGCPRRSLRSRASQRRRWRGGACVLSLRTPMLDVLGSYLIHAANSNGSFPMPIKLSENFRAVFYAPFYATQALGFYAREGVEVELVSSAVPGDAVTR